MFIQTEDTPNPQTMKFIPEIEVSPNEPHSFRSKEQASISPLATILFEIEEIESIFLGSDFISITKKSDAKWEHLKPVILGTIMDHIVAGKPIINNIYYEATTDNDLDDEIVKQIRDIIDNKVRPSVAMDGGDIIYRGFEDGIVKLELRGSCSGCPRSTYTLKNGIETMLKHYVPEVIAVEPVAAE